jgi:hypothetical protein
MMEPKTAGFYGCGWDHGRIDSGLDTCWETDSYWAGHGIFRLLWNQKFRNNIYKSLLLDLHWATLIQFTPLYLFKIHF